MKALSGEVATWAEMQALLLDAIKCGASVSTITTLVQAAHDPECLPAELLALRGVGEGRDRRWYGALAEIARQPRTLASFIEAGSYNRMIDLANAALYPKGR